ncbi:LamB/YcsF family protein [Cyclobacterium marinum]|uniref:LamB/YcsF family protein n=1 Tax=Cyclobacterium marinum (strain ATCC 25205 / DSM 745 / LMG 13164 / NCIMB 1802) TaxID=880070 RepID=G0IXS0_CYCMS|nr:LamB/YcsF family protein [Cyclobacterium marinum]AEL28067.1 LamB/YcsF family protein [Cyclobacterium marinum DSM 745]
MRKNVDLNCDLGEGMANDNAIMPFLGSCNIAAGGHAGNEKTILKTIKLAKRHQVNIGAHPSYPDQKNFGRKPMDISFSKLEESLFQQIHLVQKLAFTENKTLNHIKFHGALYLKSLTSLNLAERLAIFLSKNFNGINIYAPYGSCMAEAARKYEIPLKNEGFADRAYLTSSTLVSRKKSYALLTNLNEVKHQVLSMVNQGKVPTYDNHKHDIVVDTICVHGDHPKALEIAQLLGPLLATKSTLNH